MNQFEAAKLKQQQRADRIARYAKPTGLAEALPELPTPLPEVPEQKPRAGHAAFIRVTVTLPDRELTVCLTKPHIYQNVTPNKLTKSEIKKCIEDGFRPMLGGLDDVP